jgi:hypothetical protein
MRKLLIASLMVWMLGSCSRFDQVINVDPPTYVKKLVVHTFLNNYDSTFYCQVTRNRGLLDSAPDSAYFVSGATVQLFEDGNLKATFQTNPSIPGNPPLYTLPAGPGYLQPGKTYELKVQHPDLPSVQALQIMPVPFTVDSVSYHPNGGISSSGDHLYSMNAYLKDAPGIKNYYSIEVHAYTDIPNPIFDSQGNVIRYDTIHYDAGTLVPESSDDPNATVVAHQVVVSDQFFDGKPYHLTFNGLQNGYYTRYQVTVRSLTQDYYLYLLSAQKKLDAQDLPLAEPVTVYTNLNGGIGIFGICWEQQYNL